MIHQVLRRRLLRRPANLANQNDALRLGVVQKNVQAVNKVGAVEGIAADTDAECLPETGVGRLEHCLISQCAGTRNNPDFTGLVDMARHDADLAFTWLQKGNKYIRKDHN